VVDDWHIGASCGGVLTLTNVRDGRELPVPIKYVREFRAPNFLMLDCDVTVSETGYRYRERKPSLQPFWQKRPRFPDDKK